jgi:hypothetical protein
MANSLPGVDRNKKIAVKITPLSAPTAVGRVCGTCAAEATPQGETELVSGFVRLQDWVRTGMDTGSPSQSDLLALERQMRDAALSGSDRYFLRLAAAPAFEESAGNLIPFAGPTAAVQPPRTGDRSSVGGPLLGRGLPGGSIYQFIRFPITRFNGIALPPEATIRFADPGRWFGPGMESRLFTISIEGTTKYYSWDAHVPVGKTPHDFYHVNQKGMFNVFKQSDHAPLTRSALFRAKQLRYLKIGGRIFLVVGVIFDGNQLGAAGVESYQQKSIKPVAAQAVRTAGSWAAAWAGAKAGVAVGSLAGVETGPGMVLTAIGGGIIGGVAGYYWGANWVADWIQKN